MPDTLVKHLTIATSIATTHYFVIDTGTETKLIRKDNLKIDGAQNISPSSIPLSSISPTTFRTGLSSNGVNIDVKIGNVAGTVAAGNDPRFISLSSLPELSSFKENDWLVELYANGTMGKIKYQNFSLSSNNIKDDSIQARHISPDVAGVGLGVGGSGELKTLFSELPSVTANNNLEFVVIDSGTDKRTPLSSVPVNSNNLQNDAILPKHINNSIVGKGLIKSGTNNPIDINAVPNEAISLSSVGYGLKKTSPTGAFEVDFDDIWYQLKKQIFRNLYPVGSLFISKNRTNPEVLVGFMGSTWVAACRGQMIVGTGRNEAFAYPGLTNGGDIFSIKAAQTGPFSPNIVPPYTTVYAFERVDDNHAIAGNTYGMKLEGWLEVPTTGHYHFWVASDDTTDFSLSIDDDFVNLVYACSVPDYTDYREWTRYTSQKSSVRYLLAGTRYAYRLLYKQGMGEDYLSVGYSLTSDILRIEKIPSSWLYDTSSGGTAGRVNRYIYGNTNAINLDVGSPYGTYLSGGILGNSISALTAHSSYPSSPIDSNTIYELEVIRPLSGSNILTPPDFST